jgi:hypothetical protein
MSEQGPLNEFLAEVDSGAFERQLTAFLTEVSKSIYRFNKGGKLDVTFKIEPAATSAQNGAGIKVKVVSTAKYSRPTPTGKINEETTTETPMWVNKDGSISLLAKSHDDLFAGQDNVTKMTKD